MDYNEFMKEQYLTLRSEISERHVRRFRIMSSGIFAIPTIAFIGRYFVGGDGDQIGKILILVTPLLIFAVCLIYLSETNGIMRAGQYIRTEIEPKFISNGQIGWEQWLELESKIGNDNREVDKYINSCFFIIAFLYYTGSILMIENFIDNIFGYYFFKYFVLFLYVILGILIANLTFRKSRYSTVER